jgi:signal transduction histidine kinase
MGAMIDGLLAYARTGRERLTCEPVDVAALVAEVAANLGVPPGFEVRFAGEPPTVCAVRLHLQQVLQNLIGNAVRHHDRDSGRITVGAVRAGDRWQFQVADDGPGIPAEARERVFEVFATAAGRTGDSSGLGLAIVKKLVGDVDGAVRIEDHPPRGTRFSFDWPECCTVEA